MKKLDLLNLIRAHTENDEATFRRIANDLANEFYNSGEEDLGRQISSFLSDGLAFVPQGTSIASSFFERISDEELEKAQVFWPSSLFEDITGVTNAIKRRNGISKFLFYGSPGTGKTETAKVIAAITKCELWKVDFSALVDYRLGETAKNISDMFSQIAKSRNLKKVIFLFDEIDSIALDRINQNDLREMGRATSEFLKGMDSLPKESCIIATTNLFESMDKALLRRFDAAISFDAYSKEDLADVGQAIYSSIIRDYPDLIRDDRLFRKILESAKNPISPGDLKNLLRTCIAFGGDDAPAHYLELFFRKAFHGEKPTIENLKELGFTTRQIATLTGVSKSSVSRKAAKDE